MFLKAVVGVSIFAGTTVDAVAQDEPSNQTSKLTLADVQHLAEVISSDKSRLSRTLHAGKLHDQTQQALDQNDAKAVAALTAKIDACEQQLGPEYDKVLDGLDKIDLSSDQGQEIADVFKTLQAKCE